jgi:hypothetical protein
MQDLSLKGRNPNIVLKLSHKKKPLQMSGVFKQIMKKLLLFIFNIIFSLIL